MKAFTFEIGLDGKKALLGLNKFNKRLVGIQKTAKATNSVFNQMLKFAGFVGFTSMAKDAASFAHSLSVLSYRTGIASNKLLSMRNAFASTGGRAEEVESLIRNISSGMARLSTGDSRYAGMLTALGINPYGKTPDEIMYSMADWAKKQKTLGRSNAEIIQVLQDSFGVAEEFAEEMIKYGGKGLRQKQLEQEKKTGVLTQKNINDLDNLKKSWSEFTTTMDVSFKRGFSELAPYLSKGMDKIRSFIKENPKMVSGMVELAGAIGGLAIAGQVARMVSGLGTAFTALMAHPLVGAAIAIAAGGGYLGNKIGENPEVNKFLLGNYDYGRSEKKQDILDLVRKGKISGTQASAMLKEIGYATFYEAMNEEKVRKDINKLREKFAKGEISNEDLIRGVAKAKGLEARDVVLNGETIYSPLSGNEVSKADSGYYGLNMVQIAIDNKVNADDIQTMISMGDKVIYESSGNSNMNINKTIASGAR